MPRCYLCGHDLKRDCHYQSATSERTGFTYRLCSADDHDCYRRWLQGERPDTKAMHK